MRAVCIVAIALLLWLSVSLPLTAGEVGKPGALAQALVLPDGSPVQLTGLLVDRVVAFPPYAVVCDGQNPDDRLVVLFPAPPGLRRWQTVDVAGVLTTLPNGYRLLTGQP
jgi:hypothetical protein